MGESIEKYMKVLGPLYNTILDRHFSLKSGELTSHEEHCWYCGSCLDPKIPPWLRFNPEIISGRLSLDYEKIILELACGRPDRDSWTTMLKKIKESKDFPRELKNICSDILRGKNLYIGIDAMSGYSSELWDKEKVYLKKVPSFLKQDNIVFIKADLNYILPFIKKESVDTVVVIWSDWMIDYRAIHRILKNDGKFFERPVPYGRPSEEYFSTKHVYVQKKKTIEKHVVGGDWIEYQKIPGEKIK